tara:strand:+ start:563 stop:814 length:252 start_codon:yes stop_codon:yes gene_type:complete
MGICAIDSNLGLKNVSPPLASLINERNKIMCTIEKAKELREKERLQTIETLHRINKEKKYLKKYYEQYWCICGRTIKECEGLI